MKGGCFSAHCIPIYFHHSRWHLEEQKLMLTGLSTCVHSCGLALFPALFRDRFWLGSSSGTLLRKLQMFSNRVEKQE